MWRSLTLVAAGLLLSLALQSAYAGTQRVEGLEFERVEVFGSVEVEISQGESNALLLRGDADELEKRPFYLRGETLVLGRSADHPDERFRDVKFKLTVTGLDYLGLKGSGEAYLKPLRGPELHLVVEGSGELKAYQLRGEEISLVLAGSGDIQVVELEVERLRLVLSGSGDIHLGRLEATEVDFALKGSGDLSLKEGGKAHSIEINIAGSGDADFSGLAASEAEINIVGSGTGRVGEVKSLEANILGSGDVYYQGEPEIERSILGSGDLHQLR